MWGKLKIYISQQDHQYCLCIVRYPLLGSYPRFREMLSQKSAGPPFADGNLCLSQYKSSSEALFCYNVDDEQFLTQDFH